MRFRPESFLRRLVLVVWFYCGFTTLFSSSAAFGADETTADQIPLPEMALIPGASIEIGSLAEWRSQPIHRVEVKPFYISRFEVTFEQYDAFTETIGKAKRHDLGWGRGNRPVVDVNWDDIQEYIDWLNDVTGEKYRLPTEAEWEYAAKGDTSIDQFGWGNQFELNKANCRGCGSQWDGVSTAPVGSFEPNEFGLYDMHGNVWEVVISATCGGRPFGENPSSNETEDDEECNSTRVRGGSWDAQVGEIKTWYRAAGIRKDNVANDVGFRLAKDAEEQSK